MIQPEQLLLLYHLGRWVELLRRHAYILRKNSKLCRNPLIWFGGGNGHVNVLYHTDVIVPHFLCMI